jgi:lysophospholipase L1-like esterase
LIQQVNQRLQAIAESEPGVMFVSTAHAYLNADGKPRAEFFRDDRLHLNEDGYRIWAAILKDALARAE